MTTTVQRVGPVPVVRNRVPRCQKTTAVLNGHPVGVQQEHRRWSPQQYLPLASRPLPEWDDPVVLTVVAPVHLTVEDVVAVLFESDLSYEDLADDQLIREFVADIVTNEGCQYLAKVRCRLGEFLSFTEDGASFLAYCRHRAAALVSGLHPHRPGAVTPLKAAREQWGGNRRDLVATMRLVAELAGDSLPRWESMRAQLARWENGRTQPSGFYQRLFCRVYQCPPEHLGFPTTKA